MAVVMAVTNGRCIKTLFKRQILCAGSMRDYITIYRSALQSTTFDQKQAAKNFEIVDNMIGALEARNPVKRFDGIVIDNTFTHVIYIAYDQTIYELDLNTLFCDVEKPRTRRFKMLNMLNLEEEDKYLAIFVKETGFSDLSAADA